MIYPGINGKNLRGCLSFSLGIYLLRVRALKFLCFIICGTLCNLRTLNIAKGFLSFKLHLSKSLDVMRRNVSKLLILTIMLVVLPLMGVIAAGPNIYDYLEFPPKTRYIEHAPFSLPIFLGLGLFILLIILRFVIRSFVVFSNTNIKPGEKASFPWWGYAGFLAGVISWALAWTRFEWFGCFQLHTFIPLWLSYILVINALTTWRIGDCLMTRRPGLFVSLFPVSAAFWWFFEYLNRFVQNWYYVEVSRFSATEYFILASASFATVLPAVLGTRELLLTFPFFDKAFNTFAGFNLKSVKPFAWFSLIISGIGLACIGLLPNYLFPLLWISPLIIIVSLQTITGERHIFTDISQGRWENIVVSAMSALICGFFWEMWNYFSMAKWIYSVPFVQRYHLFEMPVLGYAGYLPFGLECAVVGDMILTAASPSTGHTFSQMPQPMHSSDIT